MLMVFCNDCWVVNFVTFRATISDPSKQPTKLLSNQLWIKKKRTSHPTKSKKIFIIHEIGPIYFELV